MNTSGNGYVLGFAIAVCVVISAGLAATATALKPAQDAAAEFDRQKNVMMAGGLLQAGDTRSDAELRALYQERVQEQVLDTKSGTVLEGKAPGDVVAMNKESAKAEDKAAKAEGRKADKAAASRYRTIAVAKAEDGSPIYILPISGKGLWSTLYGFLALAGDANTVRGITFYKHGETPGLGGEVDNPQWKASWTGKTILDDKSGALIGVKVKKGKVDPSIAAEKQHQVDGLSGATITSNGVTTFVKADLQAFQPYLKQFWKK